MLNDKSLWGKTCEIFPNTFLSVIGIIWYIPYYHGIYYHYTCIFWNSQIPSLLNSIWVPKWYNIDADIIR